MPSDANLYLGIDSGATTCKIAGIDAQGQPIDAPFMQYPTRSSEGKATVLDDWLHAAQSFLDECGKSWEDVLGVGLALPGPFLERGVLGDLPNYPKEFFGWNFVADFTSHVEAACGKNIPMTAANDGHLAGMAEASLIQATSPGSVFLLAPGSGLGSAFVDASGKLLEGDHISAAFFCCMPMPYEMLGLPHIECTSGRAWASTEGYTALSGLGALIEFVLPNYPDHAFHTSDKTLREKALSLRGLAQEGDPLAEEVFIYQAKAMGCAVAMASMAYDPTHIVIAGGLMDPEATTVEFRRNYIQQIKATASPLLWIEPDELNYHEAQLGELAQAIGAATYIRSQT